MIVPGNRGGDSPWFVALSLSCAISTARPFHVTIPPSSVDDRGRCFHASLSAYDICSDLLVDFHGAIACRCRSSRHDRNLLDGRGWHDRAGPQEGYGWKFHQRSPLQIS